MPNSQTSIEVFCCYAHADEQQLQKLEAHLSVLKHQGLISTWHDRHIIPGSDWAQAIDSHLNSASVILLLLSPEFFASDYCYGIEMKRALQRHKANEARVIPILLRPVNWKDAPFAHLQMLPTDAKPITTWRNRDEAFADVTAGIRRAIGDLRQLAVGMPTTTSFPLVWNIPYPRNPFFTGRDDLLSRLSSQLRAGQATALSQPQAISGLGGVGKTQIAVEYAYRFRTDYQAVLWARAESQETLVSSFVTIADRLSLPQKEEQDQNLIVQAVTAWLQTHTQWLLILDNADDLTVVRTFLPPAFEGHLLLTTRAQAMGRLAHKIEVETLEPDVGAVFLLRRANIIAIDASLEDAKRADRERALQITQELGGLPLALDQAGAYMEETGYSLLDYQQVYQYHRRELLQARGGLVVDHPEPIATTWSLSFAHVEARNPAAADLLRLCAYLAPDAIAEEIITRGAAHLGPLLAPIAADAFLLGQAIESLRAYSLVDLDPAARTLSVHRLVQAVLRDALVGTMGQQWMERVVLAVNEAFPEEVEFVQWPDCERCTPHALLCAIWIEHQHLVFPEAARLLNQVGFYLAERARYIEAEPLLKRALAIREQQLGPDHPDTATSLNVLAGHYADQGYYEKAEPLYQRALAIREQQLGPDHPDTGTSLNDLAILYEGLKRYEEAEPLYQRSLAIWEQQLGSEHPDVATSLNNLGDLYITQNRYDEAEPLLKRALLIWEQQLGPDHPDTAMGLDNLGDLYVNQGRYDEAEPLLKRALLIWEQQLGPVSLTAQGLNDLALLYEKQGRYEEAELLYKRALAIREQQLGPDHPHTLVVRENYTSFLRMIGRNAEAALLDTQGADGDENFE